MANSDWNFSPNNSSDHTSKEETTIYSFWGEEIKDTNIPNNASSTQEQKEDPFASSYTYSYQSYGATVPDPVKKEHPLLKKVGRILLCASCFGIVAAGCFFGSMKLYSHFTPNSTVAQNIPEAMATKFSLSIASTETSTVGEMNGSDAVTSVVRNAMPAMVSITSTVQSTSYFFGQPYAQESTSGGSGIIVGKNDTDILIATNHHVIDSAVSIDVTFTDGSTAKATVKGSDALADLAIIAVNLKNLTQTTLSNIDIAVLGDSESVNVGEMVIAIGNALGYGPTTTVGYLSAKDREVSIDGNNMILLQTDAAINHGNSGGALLNARGEVIGINNAKLSSTSVEGICFAIPISKAIPILNELMTREILQEEEKGYLGISVQELDDSIYQFFSDWPEGVYVYSVNEGSPAEAVGIYAGDMITAVNGVSVTTSNQLINAVTSNRIGTTIEITLQRVVNGAFQEFVYEVTLGPKPTTN